MVAAGCSCPLARTDTHLMDDSAQQKTHRPVEGAKIAPRGYYLAVTFHPSIKLERKRGYEFAANLTDYVDPSNASVEQHKWTFSQPMDGSVNSKLYVAVTTNRIEISLDFPKNAKEWFEERQISILKRFAEQFKPGMILESAAMIRGTLEIDGDARTFLARNVMNIDEGPLRPFARPIHVIGLRLVFPPFEVKRENETRITDWLVEVKAESLSEDPSRLFLEADGRWHKPATWSDDNIIAAVRRQNDVSSFLEENVAEFLKQSASGDWKEE